MKIKIIENLDQINLLQKEEVVIEQFGDDEKGQIVEVIFDNGLSIVYCNNGEDYQIIYVEYTN